MGFSRAAYIAGFNVSFLLLLSNAAFSQEERTVRLATGGLDVSTIYNIQTVYQRVQDTINGRIDIVNRQINDSIVTIEDLRRQINNIQTVTYRTETVYVDRPIIYSGDDGGSDDGGGGGGGGDGGGCGG